MTHDAFRSLASGQICDAMDALGLPRNVVTGLAPLSESALPLIGRAFTLQQIRVVNGAAPGKALHAEVARELAGAGEIIVIDCGGYTDVCTWGYAHSMRAAIQGVAGVVIDGAVRDSAEIRESGFPLFCRGRSPVKSTGNLMTIAMREPVSMGGAVIRQGDLLFADQDGVVCIPVEHENAILEKAMEVHRIEAERDDALRAQLAEKRRKAT